MTRKLFYCMVVAVLISGCNEPSIDAAALNEVDWKEVLDDELPLLGHRNWILVVDKAFPLQTSPGMEVINTDEDLLPVLEYTLDKIKSSPHLRPVIYADQEINYIAEEAAKGVNDYKTELKKILGGLPVQSILHDSVFTKLDASSRLFKVFILKTNEVIPYTSLFIQLDCGYWDASHEKLLRDSMRAHMQ